DTFHGIDIDWASINYTIIETSINGSMGRIMPGESVYSAENIPLTNLLGRGVPYLLNITAIATNCEAYSKTIELFVINKTRTILTVSELTGSFIQGHEIRIEATLRNVSSGDGIPGATIRFTFGGVILDQIAITNQEGVAVIDISIPAESFSIQAFFDGTSSVASASTSGETISVISYADIGLWIGLIAATCVISVLAARQFYFKPKKNRQLQEFQKIADKFQDVANLRHLFILHKAAGVCLFQQSFGGEVDGQLISGFLSAISTFQTELKPEKLPQMTTKTGGFELNYQDYKILLFTGTLMNLALTVDATPSEEFRQRAQLLVQEYERKYHDALAEWRGDVTPFKTSYDLIAEILELSLIWPHQLNRPMSMDKISSLEASLIQISDTIMKSQATSYFFLPMVISVGQASQPKKKLEVIANIYNLHKLNIFNPINLETIG
ncbi:MAG: Ig-like domain-containing protein, partial [Promethearchaeota archaeon]